jgi:LPPG:FO 2-phospho-L-lactate transferase
MAPGVEHAIANADIVVVCPSNPWVSIGPILRVSGIKETLAQKNCVAVSPIVGGAAIKGPAAKMYQELGILPSAVSVAEQYRNWVNGFVMDEQDIALREKIESLGLVTLVTDTIMNSTEDRRQLAMKILEFCSTSIRNPSR